MRVVEPDKNNKVKGVEVLKKRTKKPLLAVFVIVLFAGLGVVFILNQTDTEDVPVLQLVEDTRIEEISEDDVAAGQANGDEKYQSLWYALTIPDTLTPAVTPDMGDDTEFSRLVSSIAESRGYQLQKVYSGDELGSYRGVVVAQSVIDPLTELVAAASQEGLSLSVSSGYRALDEQEDIFISRYNSQRASGKSVENAIVAVLEGAAPPGYSKHHSAYTVDMTCAGLGAKNFIGTACDEWLSANDYAIAREYGFIPSYPKNIDVQGPIPEPWEYNYVGTDVLRDVGLL